MSDDLILASGASQRSSPEIGSFAMRFHFLRGFVNLIPTGAFIISGLDISGEVSEGPGGASWVGGQVGRDGKDRDDEGGRGGCDRPGANLRPAEEAVAELPSSEVKN